MLTSLTLAFAVALAAPAPAAAPLSAKAESALRAQTTRLFDAWIRGDDEEFVRSLYPGLVRALGGSPRAVETIRSQRAQLAQAGFSTTTSTVGKVRSCVRVAKELQCVVEGSQVMRTPKGRLTVQTATIAFSKDGGVRWTFLSISSDDDVRKTFPEVSAELPLALDEAPQLEPEADGAAPAPAAVTP